MDSTSPRHSQIYHIIWASFYMFVFFSIRILINLLCYPFFAFLLSINQSMNNEHMFYACVCVLLLFMFYKTQTNKSTNRTNENKKKTNLKTPNSNIRIARCPAIIPYMWKVSNQAVPHKKLAYSKVTWY